MLLTVPKNLCSGGMGEECRSIAGAPLHLLRAGSGLAALLVPVCFLRAQVRVLPSRLPCVRVPTQGSPVTNWATEFTANPASGRLSV